VSDLLQNFEHKQLQQPSHVIPSSDHQRSLEPIQDTLNSQEKRNARLLEVENEILQLRGYTSSKV